MFKNINNLLILIAGLIICYIFYNVFILENFARLSINQIENKRIFEYNQANELVDFVNKLPDGPYFVKKGGLAWRDPSTGACGQPISFLCYVSYTGYIYMLLAAMRSYIKVKDTVC